MKHTGNLFSHSSGEKRSLHYTYNFSVGLITGISKCKIHVCEKKVDTGNMHYLYNLFSQGAYVLCAQPIFTKLNQCHIHFAGQSTFRDINHFPKVSPTPNSFKSIYWVPTNSTAGVVGQEEDARPALCSEAATCKSNESFRTKSYAMINF